MRWCNGMACFPIRTQLKVIRVCLDVLAERGDGYKWDLSLTEVILRGIGWRGLDILRWTQQTALSHRSGSQDRWLFGDNRPHVQFLCTFVRDLQPTTFDDEFKDKGKFVNSFVIIIRVPCDHCSLFIFSYYFHCRDLGNTDKEKGCEPLCFPTKLQQNLSQEYRQKEVPWKCLQTSIWNDFTCVESCRYSLSVLRFSLCSPHFPNFCSGGSELQCGSIRGKILDKEQESPYSIQKNEINRNPLKYKDL